MNPLETDQLTLKHIHLRIDSTTPAETVLAWFEALNQPPLDDRVLWWQCQTVLKEVFDNVVCHAHEHLPPNTPIELEAVLQSQQIILRVWDRGPVFDLQQKLRELPELEENDQDHGRGLKIIAKIADHLSYTQTEDQRNCFLFIKKFSVPVT
jgi:serine/threonine-protein kinase RsbW